VFLSKPCNIQWIMKKHLKRGILRGEKDSF
jgi:hypothetical protein